MNMLGPGGCRPPPPEYKLNVAQNMGMCQPQFPAQQGYMPPARQSLSQGGAQSRRAVQQQPIPPSGKLSLPPHTMWKPMIFVVKLIEKIAI